MKYAEMKLKYLPTQNENEVGRKRGCHGENRVNKQLRALYAMQFDENCCNIIAPNEKKVKRKELT